MTHTPGPWIDSPEASDAVISKDPDAMADDGSGVKYYGGALIAESIDHKNKPLIKAAPALLAACKYVLARLDQIDGRGFDQLDANECRTLLRKRIAAAEPEPTLPNED